MTLRKICAAMMAIATLPAAISLAGSPPPPEAFGTLPVQTDLQMSPDGHWLAWFDHAQPKPRVVIFDLVTRKPQRILAVPERVKLRALAWNDNETLLIGLSETEESTNSKQRSHEFYRVIAHDVHGGDGRMLPMDPDAVARHEKQNPPLVRLVRTHTSKPHTVIAAAFGGCRRVVAGCLLEIDTVTGRATVIKVGNEFTNGWAVDRDGQPLAREDWDWHQKAYRVFALEPNDHIKEITRTDDSEHPNLQGVMPDNSGLLMLATNGHPHQAAWVLPLDGSAMRLLVEDPDADVEATRTDPNTGAVIAALIGGTQGYTKWIEPQAQHRAEVMGKTFPGKTVEMINWSIDGSKLLAKVQTPSSPALYYWIDFTTHHADIAGEEYPALANVALGRAEKITYKARDGMTIPAILTRPPEDSATPIALIVLPHGGPNAHDEFQFDWLAQFFATRGYAVLQPQFRGSTGFGQAFEEAGYRQWGGVMQDDVTDGVKAMIERGLVDARRVCIVGASYGGYAALAGAAFTPDLYRCAASINGVSDLPALMRSEVPLYDGAISASKSFWKLRIGSPNESRLDAVSPINSVKTIAAPVLIIYGTGDGVVPNEQSQKMINAMRSAGKNVQVDLLQGEDHWLSQTETRTQVLRTLDSFLKANL
jgi:dipeptidyl aminopeptidase/acylaminoacyl peptidase